MSPAAPGPSSASQGASTLVNSYDAQCLAHGSTGRPQHPKVPVLL